MSEGVYVAMKLINHLELREFFNKKGLPIDEDYELHCTLAYSEKHFVPKIKPTKVITVTTPFFLGIYQMGDAVVLRFDSRELTKIFKEFISDGAEYDFDEYRPHVTLFTPGRPDDEDYPSVTVHDHILSFDRETGRLVKVEQLTGNGSEAVISDLEIPDFSLILGEMYKEELSKEDYYNSVSKERPAC